RPLSARWAVGAVPALGVGEGAGGAIPGCLRGQPLAAVGVPAAVTMLERERSTAARAKATEEGREAPFGELRFELADDTGRENRDGDEAAGDGRDEVAAEDEGSERPGEGG